jgi:hypothetical protein
VDEGDQERIQQPPVDVFTSKLVGPRADLDLRGASDSKDTVAQDVQPCPGKHGDYPIDWFLLKNIRVFQRFPHPLH